MNKTKLFLALGLCCFLNLAHSAPKSRKVLPPKTQKRVLELFKINEKLHEAFYRDEVKEAEKAAKELKRAYQKIKDPEIQEALKSGFEGLSEIRLKNSLRINHEHYDAASSALIWLLETYGLGSQYNAFRCPMVRKKWVQDTRKTPGVQNPYAPKMRACGVQETHF